jgi:hypothetical protein
MTNLVHSSVHFVKLFGRTDVVEQPFKIAVTLATDHQRRLDIDKHAFTERGQPTVRMFVGQVYLPLQGRGERAEQASKGGENQHRATGVEFRYSEVQQQLTSVRDVPHNSFTIGNAGISRQDFFARDQPFNGQVGVGYRDRTDAFHASPFSRHSQRRSSRIFLISEATGVVSLAFGDGPSAHNSRDRKDRLNPCREAIVGVGEGNDSGQREQPDSQDYHGRTASARQCRSNEVLHGFEPATSRAA